MTEIAHLSDPHFGTVVPEVRDALLDELHARPPDLVVVTGDITQRARRAQFRAARAFLDALPPVPRRVLPGNHDIPLFDVFTRLFAPYRHCRRFLGPELDPGYRDATLALFCVDATRRWCHKRGVLGARQIEDTAEALAHAPQPFKVVATHQPLAVTEAIDVRNLAARAQPALDHWIRCGADLFLGGHIHLPYLVTVTSRDRAAIFLNAGTSFSSRVRGDVPNSYNRIVLEERDGERRMTLERRDFCAATGAFATERIRRAVAAGAEWRVEPATADGSATG